MATATQEYVKSAKVCPISKEHFKIAAKPIEAVIDGQTVSVDVKEFQTGSVGWYQSGKINLRIGGVLTPCQMGITVTVIGSKVLTA